MKKNKKKILILGASSDIGIATIKLFLQNEWNVTAHLNSNKKSFKIFKKYKKNLNFMKYDLRKIYGFEKYINKNKIKFRNYDAFINLTGYFKSATFKNFKAKDIHDHLNVNSISSFLIIRELLSGMIKKKWGRIVNTTSIGTKFGGGEMSFPYSISKFINEFFPSIYKKYYLKNILINTLQIGVVNTKMHKKLPLKNLNKRVGLIPIKRMAQPKEVANYLFYLCGNENSLTTGQIINISGGE